jgi:acetolactate synthase-1/2/3 large subunit
VIEKKSDGHTGGHLVAESLKALGTKSCFGLPGQHALGMFDGV